MHNMFSPRGEVNAHSVHDALQVLSKYASAMEQYNNNLPSNAALHTRSSFSNEKRDELIAKALLTHDGKQALAQAMASPIR